MYGLAHVASVLRCLFEPALPAAAAAAGKHSVGLVQPARELHAQALHMQPWHAGRPAALLPAATSSSSSMQPLAWPSVRRPTSCMLARVRQLMESCMSAAGPPACTCSGPAALLLAAASSSIVHTCGGADLSLCAGAGAAAQAHPGRLPAPAVPDGRDEAPQHGPPHGPAGALHCTLCMMGHTDLLHGGACCILAARLPHSLPICKLKAPCRRA